MDNEKQERLIEDHPTVLLEHGGGGRLTQRLIADLFLDAFDNPQLRSMHDGAILSTSGRLAFSTDSYVISPYFFPGGDIGSLAIHGTVNDLAMCGAKPSSLSAGFILEEGLPMPDLCRVVRSMRAAADEAGVAIVTGDTKVVNRGKGDGIYINTAGIGAVASGVDIRPDRAAPGDVLLLSGAIAMHGIAVLSVREGLRFATSIESDSAPLNGLVEAILAVDREAIHVLRDPTRGGVAGVLGEIAASANVGIRITERDIPIPAPVQGACEILGFDPLYIANEGKCVVVLPEPLADRVLDVMRAHPLGAQAAKIGHVTSEHAGQVLLESRIGGTRVVPIFSGEQLPRIC